MALAKMFTKKKTKLKQYIKLKQNKEYIEIEGFLSNPAYKVKELVFYLRNDEKMVVIKNIKDDHQFLFQCDLTSYMDQFDIKEGVYNIAINVSVHESVLSEKQIINLKTKSTTKIHKSNGTVDYLIRLGRFKETDTEELQQANINGSTFELYKTIKGNLAFGCKYSC